jgi:hypothetical protein
MQIVTLSSAKGLYLPIDGYGFTGLGNTNLK